MGSSLQRWRGSGQSGRASSPPADVGARPRPEAAIAVDTPGATRAQSSVST